MELERFSLVHPLPGGSIPIGSIGVVLLAYDKPRRASEVEFLDRDGRNIGAKYSARLPTSILDATILRSHAFCELWALPVVN
jgi:hypothetical protein